MKGVADSLLLVSEPFAVAYGMDALLHTMIIDIGAGTTDFCVMNGRYPTDDDQRTLTHAGDSVDEQLVLQIRAGTPTRTSRSTWCATGRRRTASSGEPKGPVVVEAPVDGKPTSLEITTEMRKACESIVGPLSETMLDLLSRVEPGIPAARAEQHRPGRGRLAHPRPRHGAGEGARRRRRREGPGRGRPGLRRRERVPRDRGRRPRGRLGAPGGMSGEDPASSRIRRMLPSVSEVLKELTARAPIEPDVAFRVAREVCAEELKRIRDAGGESVPLEDLVQRAILRATRGATSPSVVAPAPVAPPPQPRREEAHSVEDPFSETTGALDLRWDRDAREPFTEPQAVVPLPADGLDAGGETAVEIPVLPIPPDEGPPSAESRPVRPADAEGGEAFGDETLGRLSREAESIDLREVFAPDAQQAPISFPSPVDDALPVAPVREPDPRRSRTTKTPS